MSAEVNVDISFTKKIKLQRQTQYTKVRRLIYMVIG